MEKQEAKYLQQKRILQRRKEDAIFFCSRKYRGKRSIPVSCVKCKNDFIFKKRRKIGVKMGIEGGKMNLEFTDGVGGGTTEIQ